MSLHRDCPGLMRNQKAYDYIVVNDDLDECAAAVQKYVEAAKNVPSRRREFIKEIREELKGFAKGAK